MYRKARLKLISLIASFQLANYDDKILQGCPDQKSVFTFLDKVSHRNHDVLPDLQAAQLVHSFNNYFV